MRLIILFLFTLTSININASKAVRYFRDITLKDGRIVSATLVGDENLHFYKTRDGEIILYNSDGDYYHTASKEQIDSLNAIADTQQQQASENRAKMMRSSVTASGNNGHLTGYKLFPSKGSPKVLVLMVEFSDVPFTFGQDDFEKFLNSTEITTDVKVETTTDDGKTHNIVAKSQGSVAQYFRSCSGGLFSPQFDIYGTFKVNNTAAYYSKHENEFIKNACEAAEGTVNFADYDQDGDGNVDLVYIIYAGYGGAWGIENVIWPKVKYTDGGSFCTVGGLKVHRAGLSNEINFSPKIYTENHFEPQLAGIGVFVHEFCHAMGITDLYATSTKQWPDSDYDNHSMEDWSLMDGGENRLNSCLPTPLNAFERYLFGWIDDIQELTEPQKVTLTPLKDGGQPYKISGNNANEYWILEAIPADEEWYMFFDQVTGNGMLVTHVNTSINNFSIGSGLPNGTKGKSGITIVPADGRLIGFHNWTVEVSEFEASLLSDPFPGSEGVTQLTDYWAKDGTIDKPIYNIVQNADYSVGFNFMFIRGDANDDGEINMSDATSVTNYILGNPEASFKEVAADANEDGKVTMADVMYIVNYALNGKFPDEK